MSKLQWKGSTLLAPVPAALVSCGTLEKPNALTIAWTGITCSDPPMTYISVRPERYSYDIIKESGEFVINLTSGTLSVGDEIRLVDHKAETIQKVDSLQVEHQAVTSIKKGDDAGIKLAKPVKAGTEVYKQG